MRAQALKREQLAALVGAADPKNPALTLIAAWCAKGRQNGNRAAQEYLLDWDELSEVTGEDGTTRGFVTEVGQTKVDQLVDREQRGKRKPLQCPTSCPGHAALTQDGGAFDTDRMCAGHLLKHARGLIAESVGVAPEDVKGPMFADYGRIGSLRLGAEGA